MRTKTITLGCLLMFATMMMAQGIKQHKYWIDSDYSNHKSVTSSSTTISLTVSTAGLSSGLHFLNHRALNTNDEWGTLSRTLFYIPENVSENAQIAEYEYWIDGDVENRQSGKVAKEVYELTTDVSKLADGEHTFNFRAKNTDGVWGTIYTESFTTDKNAADNLLTFADNTVKTICLTNWDTDNDQELSKAEAAAVTSLGEVFKGSEITSFDELEYFTGLTKIDNWAFGNCANLKSLSLPATVTEIGMNAFTNCTSLQKMHLPSSVATIGESAFAGCKGLSVFTVASENASYTADLGLLYNKDRTILISCPAGMTGDVTLPENVVKIEANAFYNCSAVTSISLPVTLQEIGAATFVGCSSLTALDIPASVKTIGMGGFTGCTALKSFTVDGENTVYSAPDGVLIKDNTSLIAYPNAHGTIYTASEGITTIEPYAFCMTAIEELTLPSTLKSIGENAVSYCSSLEKVSFLSTTPPTISPSAFSEETYSNAVISVPEGSKAAYEAVDGLKAFTTIVETGSVSDGLKDGDTFEATVSGTTFRFMVLSAADKTCQVGVNTPLSERRNDYWGDAITTSITKFVTVPGKVTATDNNEYTVVKIGENAFVSYDQMEYVNLPSSIKEIGFQSFYYCRGLKIIAMQEGLTQISGYAFGACYNLSLVEIPSTVTSIGAFAFWDCRRLTDVISKIETPFALNGYEFNNTMSKLNLTVPAGKASIYKETDGWKEFAKIEEMSSDVTDGLKSGDIFEATVDGITFKFRVLDPYAKTCQIGADQKCDAKVSGSGWDGTLPSVVTGSDGIEYTVTGIGNRAFWDYGTGLKTVTLPSTLEWIDEGAFMRCKGLQSIVIPEGVKSIENYAFNGCSALETVELPSTLTGIANNAFGGCPITKVVAKMEELFPIGDETFPSDVTIVVPKGSLDTYKDAYGWKNYENIVEDEGDETVVEQDGFVLTPNEEEKSVTVDSYDETAKEVEIMPTVEIEGEQYDVTAIGEGAFENNETMEKVTIPEGVVSIGNNAFKGCVSLKEIFCYATEPATLGNSKVKARTRGDGVEAEVEVASVFEGVNTETCILYVPEGCADKYREADGWKEFKNIVEMKGTEVPESESVTISAALQVPYYSEYNLDFTDKPELKAYVATGYDKSTGVIWLTRVKQVPAETGFLLMGDPGDYDIPTIDGVSDVYYKNMFKGTLEGTTLYTTDGDYTNYYLSKGDAGVGFYKVTKEEGVKVGANRCYLPILTEIPANGSTGDTELIKVSAAKQVPYYTSKNLDFSSLDAQGVKAYTATGYNYHTGVIWLTRVKKVPAQTGILVMADVEGDYNVPTASVQSIYENMFVGSETAQTIYTNEEIDGVDYVNYYLSKGDAGVGFYKVTNPDGVKMGANRCYLPIPKRDAASGVRGKSGESAFCQMILSDENNDDVIAIPVFGGMNGEDDGTTGIDIQSSIFNDQSNEVYYNLQGQRVENPRKGIYIKNGRKVVIK